MASGSSTASKRKQQTKQLLERFEKLIEKSKEFREYNYEVLALKKNYPTSPPPSNAKEEYKDKKKTGPGHEASGAGGGGDGGGDDGGDGGHVYARPKTGFIFCLKCREYIPIDDFDDHVNERHPPNAPMDGDESDD